MEEKKIRLTPPLDEDLTASLRIGDRVLISGVIYTARDSAHKRFFELLDKGEDLPIPLKGEIIYFVGPSPAKPGSPIGSAGPTTSGRMDAYTPRLHDLGLKATIGKGQRSDEVKEALIRNKAVYLMAVGGAAALIARSVKSAEVIAYPEFGAEAVRRVEVVDFPAIVVNDSKGGDLFKEGVAKYRKTS